jgi:hypothetical protein
MDREEMMAVYKNCDIGQCRNNKRRFQMKAPFIINDEILSGNTHFLFKVLVNGIKEFFSI